MKLSAWLEQGPFTLALSSAFFGFYAHTGVVQALTARGFTPARLTGCSAGAIIAGALASGLAPSEIGALLLGVRRQDFWDPGLGFGLLRGQKFARYLHPHLVSSFAETTVPLGVSVFDVGSLRTLVLESGPLVPAIVASCAVPLFFHPVFHQGRVLLDGGVLHKSAIRAPASERVLGIYLDGPRTVGWYENRWAFWRLAENHKVLRLANLPAVGPNSLARGAEAMAAARARVARALDAELAGNFLVG